MQNIHQYSRSEWNHARHKWIESNLIYRKPSVWYYIANKYAYIHYDTESFWYDVFDIFRKNDEAKEFLKNGILNILVNYEWKEWSWDWFYLDIKWLSPSQVENASEEIYKFLLAFGKKFIVR